jgi:hypothetical protein
MACEDKEDKSEFNLQEYLANNSPGHRLLLQLQCVERYQAEMSSQQSDALTWDDTMLLWISSGHAKIFSDEYSEDIELDLLYQHVMDPDRS